MRSDDTIDGVIGGDGDGLGRTKAAYACLCWCHRSFRVRAASVDAARRSQGSQSRARCVCVREWLQAKDEGFFFFMFQSFRGRRWSWGDFDLVAKPRGSQRR